jgi:adenosylmethionine-8-amino-7-oxononanoate aminotransferase
MQSLSFSLSLSHSFSLSLSLCVCVCLCAAANHKDLYRDGHVFNEFRESAMNQIEAQHVKAVHTSEAVQDVQALSLIAKVHLESAQNLQKRSVLPTAERFLQHIHSRFGEAGAKAGAGVGSEEDEEDEEDEEEMDWE